ncbi:MAG TPA: sigma-70 family RNA polymerase sigma factor [Polyangiaceae bacterium]|nr:sigma-70 family RNA polymerase sigma factor [Polyangiaceae bacterium]
MTSQDLIRAIFLSGRERWPEVPLALEVFAERCEHVLSHEGELPLEAADFYLCCACAVGQPEALRKLESECSSVAQSAIRRIDRDEDFVRETLQELWRKLLVGPDAKVRSYSGRGPLQAWLRVAATRVALDRRRVGKAGARRHAELSEQLAATDLDFEASLLRARFGPAFQQALRASLAALSKQERNVLRLHAVGHCSIDEIGRAYAVHRATAARWIERSRSKIYAEVRDSLRVEHGLTASEFKSLAVLLGAELELSLGATSRVARVAGPSANVEASG